MADGIRRRHPYAVPCRGCQQLIVWFRNGKGFRTPVDESSTRPTDAAHQLDLTRHKKHPFDCSPSRD